MLPCVTVNIDHCISDLKSALGDINRTFILAHPVVLRVILHRDILNSETGWEEPCDDFDDCPIIELTPCFPDAFLQQLPHLDVKSSFDQDGKTVTNTRQANYKKRCSNGWHMPKAKVGETPIFRSRDMRAHVTLSQSSTHVTCPREGASQSRREYSTVTGLGCKQYTECVWLWWSPLKSQKGAG